MVIMTEQTPNPASLKLLPGGLVMGNGTAYLPSEAARSPLARRRFEIDGVSEGTFGSDVMAVTRTRDLDWRLHKPPILGAIMDSFASGAPLLPEGTDRSGSACAEHAEHEDSAGEDGDGQDDGIVTRRKDLLDTRLRQVVARDASDILFRGFDRGSWSCTRRAPAPAAPALPQP